MSSGGYFTKFGAHQSVPLYDVPVHAITNSGVLCPGINSLTASSSWVFRPRLAVLLYSWVDQAFLLSLNDVPNLGLIKEVFRAFVRPTSALGLPV